MIAGHPEICLFQPEIPQNTGAIGRLVAGIGGRLHLVKPFGFSLSDKNLRRPGLDYWPFLDLEIHDELAHVLALHRGQVAFFTKFADKLYTAMPHKTRLLVFGRETSGLPEWIHKQYPEDLYRIPIFHPDVRSLNLANAVAIAAYHQLKRQQNILS